MERIVRQGSAETVKNIWLKFPIVYASISSEKPSEEMMANLFEKTQDCITFLFYYVTTSLDISELIQHHIFTLFNTYVRAMTYHVPTFFESYKSLKIFTGQDVDKKNDVARSVVLRKSNIWNSVKDALRVEKGQLELRNQQRSKRKYNKNIHSTGSMSLQNKEKRT